MTELVPPEQPYYMGDNNGCLVQLLHFFGDIAIIAAMGFFVPSGRTRHHQEQQTKVESVKQDSTVVSKDTLVVMSTDGRIFDGRTNQIIVNASKDYSKALAELGSIRSANFEKVK